MNSKKRFLDEVLYFWTLCPSHFERLKRSDGLPSHTYFDEQNMRVWFVFNTREMVQIALEYEGGAV